MRYFPIFIELSAGRTALVYGGSEEAARKVRLLLKTQAAIAVVAEHLNDELTGLLAAGKIQWRARQYTPDQLDDAACIIVASAERASNAISTFARARQIPVNVVDCPEKSTFIIPAIIDRDPLVVAIGTEGAGPVLAQGIRARIEAMLAPNLGELLQYARQVRNHVAGLVPAGALRRKFWNEFFFGSVRDAFDSGGDAACHREVTRLLGARDHQPRGRIVLVNVPEDRELLTLKAHRYLQEADIIVHEESLSGDVFEYARRDADRHPVPFNAWNAHPLDHRRLAHSLIAMARRETLVVRLYSNCLEALNCELHELQAARPADAAIDIIPLGLDHSAPWEPLCGQDYTRTPHQQLRIAS